MPKTKMIQVRSVPESLHRELMKRAQALGLTLTDYIQRILEREVARPPAGEVFARVAKRADLEGLPPDADVFRDVGVASAAALDLLLSLEEELGVTIPDDKFNDARSVRAITEMIAGLEGVKGPT